MINDFIYDIPVRIYFGRDQLKHLGAEETPWRRTQKIWHTRADDLRRRLHQEDGVV